ncbi:MAG: hypothetical protein GX621_05845 [Pirellulaceae bacterium]|nr:hypothetical protein [Pirellulaceae bacterium]
MEGVKLSVSVERDKPLLDGGAYLRVLTERESGDAHIANAIRRQLELTDRVDITKPHVVSFDVRIDRLGAFDKRNDRFIICSSSDPTAMATVEPTSGWNIRIAGEDHGGGKARHWRFVSGDRKGREVRVDSRIPATENTPYSFRITVDPEARRWTPSLSVDGGPWTTFKPMGMRMAGNARECGYWPFLYLWCMLDGVDNGDEREFVEFSIDSIRIVPSEEKAKK